MNDRRCDASELSKKVERRIGVALSGGNGGSTLNEKI